MRKFKALLVLLFAVGTIMPLKAQDYLYVGFGYSKQSGLVRAGLIIDDVGAEIHLKTDFNRPFKSVSAMDGYRHRFSFMGGLTYNLLDFLHLTANVGYGSAGVYRATPSNGSYGVEGLVRGLEAGGMVDVFLGEVFSVFGGWSRIFSQRNGPYSEFTIGIGIRL